MPNTSHLKKQIFQAEKPTKWNRFIWTVRILLFILFILLTIGVISLERSSEIDTTSSGTTMIYRKLVDMNLKKEKADSLSLSHFKIDLEKIRKSHKHNFYQKNKSPQKTIPSVNNLRAGFYVNWDIQSYLTLKRNIKKLNLVLPEWYFISRDGLDFRSEIDEKALVLMHQEGIEIMPMLSNFIGEDWNGNAVTILLKNKKVQSKFIEKITLEFIKNGFSGINIDFEELTIKDDALMIDFMAKLSESFHKNGMKVSQDIAPFNADYPVEKLQAYVDYFYLMAYDQHNQNSVDGAIADIKWVEKAIEDLDHSNLLKKVVLCLPAYGYDWPEGYIGENITYAEALSLAKKNKQTPDFSNRDYNVYFNYMDGSQKKHQVVFCDAVTLFNLMRTAEDFGMAGVSIWRLGSEDPRIWQFYQYKWDLNSTNKQINHLLSLLSNANALDEIDYMGAGEILEVMTGPAEGKLKLEWNTRDALIAEETYASLPTSYVISKTGELKGKIVLTFDDGPDDEFTPKILDILQKEHVPAVFFVTGASVEQNIPLLKRIYSEGHEIGNHTFTHANLEASSDERTQLELQSTRRLIEAVTGHSTRLFRPPYNADAEPTTASQLKPVLIAAQEGYFCIGASIDSRDWEANVSKDTIVKRCIKQHNLGNIILMHDAGGDRNATIQALPEVIKAYKKMGYEFVSLSTLSGKNKNDLMPTLSGSLDRFFSFFNASLAVFAYINEHLLFSIFLFGLIIGTLRLFFLIALALKVRFSAQKTVNVNHLFPPVSILVPAYNEGVHLKNNLLNLLKTEYPNFEIIVIDDGSKDNTYEIAQSLSSEYSKIKAISKINGGKASALNRGIQEAQGDILICVDADSRLKPDAIKHLVNALENPEIAAAAGYVKVGNKVNLLTNWQNIEYTSSQNFERMAFAEIDAIMVIPGAIGAFKKQAILEVGGFETDTLAEDCDLSMRLYKAGYRLTTVENALAVTEAPEFLNSFIKQRKRWTYGIMQCFWKHRDAFLRTNCQGLGWIVLPNILIFQLILPALSPLVDIAILIGLSIGKAKETLLLYLAFFFAESIIVWLAFRLNKQKFTLKIWGNFFLQRILYRWLMAFILYHSFIRALKGEFQHWGVLKRTGNLEELH